MGTTAYDRCAKSAQRHQQRIGFVFLACAAVLAAYASVATFHRVQLVRFGVEMQAVLSEISEAEDIRYEYVVDDKTYYYSVPGDLDESPIVGSEITLLVDPVRPDRASRPDIHNLAGSLARMWALVAGLTVVGALHRSHKRTLFFRLVDPNRDQIVHEAIVESRYPNPTDARGGIDDPRGPFL